MISYGGLPLSIPDGLELPALPAMELQRPFWTGTDDWRVPQFGPEQDVQLGRLYWPRGASRFAQAHFVVSDATLVQLRRKAYTGDSRGQIALDLVLSSSSASNPLDPDRSITAPMYFLPPRPLYQFVQKDAAPKNRFADNLNLLTLVDERFYWWRAGGTIGPHEEWSSLYDAIGIMLGVSITIDEIDAKYLVPSGSTASTYEYLPLLLDAVAYSVGQRITRSFAGDVKARNYDSLREASDDLYVRYANQPEAGKDRRIDGGFMRLQDPADRRQDLVSLVPSQVTMRVPTSDGDYTTYTKTLNALGLDEYANLTVKDGDKVVHNDGLIAEMGDSSTVVNEDDIKDLLAQWSEDWYKLQLGDTSVTLSGVVPWDEDGLADVVEFKAWPTMQTVVSREPMNDLATQLLHAADVPDPTNDEPIFPATLTRKNQVDGKWRYAWTRDTFSDDEVQTQGDEETGTLQPVPVVTHTQTQDGINVDIWTVVVVGATGGTITYSEDGTPLTPANWNASDGTINALLTHFAVSTTVTTDPLGVVTYTHVFTSDDPTAPHTIGADGDSLEPKSPHSPAVFRNNLPMGVPVAVWLKKAWGGKPEVTARVIQRADASAGRHAIIAIKLKNLRDGTYQLRFTTDDAWQVIDWNADASDIQTALSMLLAVSVTDGSDDEATIFNVEVTADYLDHEMLVDASGLFGNAYYVVVWSNGNACTGPFGGLEPSVINGYVGAQTPTLTVTQTLVGDGASQKDTFVIRPNFAGSGSFDLVADGGSPVNTAYGSCPTISGWVVTTQSDGSCLLQAPDTTPGHTIVGYPGKLRPAEEPLQFLASLNNCAILVDPTQCPPVAS